MNIKRALEIYKDDNVVITFIDSKGGKKQILNNESTSNYIDGQLDVISVHDLDFMTIEYSK